MGLQVHVGIWVVTTAFSLPVPALCLAGSLQGPCAVLQLLLSHRALCPLAARNALPRGKGANPIAHPKDCRLGYPAHWSQKIQVALMSSPDLAALGAGRMGIPSAHTKRRVPPAHMHFGALLQSPRLPRQRRAGKLVLWPPSLLLGSCWPTHLMPRSHFQALSWQLRGGSPAGFTDPHATNHLNKRFPLML